MPDTPIKPKVRCRSTIRGRPVYIVDGSRTPQLKAKEKPGPYMPDCGPQQLDKLLNNLTHRYGERFQPDAGWAALLESMYSKGVKS